MSFKVKAVFDYTSGHEDDLPFSIGQIITVTDEEDADWYGGEYVDDNGVKQEGIFPRNFVEKYEPTAPPRPTRTRTKNHSKQQSTASEAPAATTPPLLSPKLPAHEPEKENEHVTVTSPSRTSDAPAPAPAAAPQPPAPRPVEPKPAETFSPPPPAAPKPAPAPALALAQAPAPVAVPSPAPPKPAPTQSKPSGPPPVAEKPSSFKDRIAAFNKAAAPPVAPFKPSGLGSGNTGFIKKPFVAPPPSRNAYLPPAQAAPVAKVYRRDEDPEIKEREAENQESAEKAGLVPGSSAAAGNVEGEDEPKPLTLKERLALLQKQQMEAAQRQADNVAKKEKPKRPATKKRMEGHEGAGEESEASTAPPSDGRNSEEHAPKQSLDEARPPRLPPQPRRKSSKGSAVHDGNEADMSGAGEMTEGQDDERTEREEGEEQSRKHIATVAKQEDDDLNEEEIAPEDEDDDEEEEEEEEEEEVDPEVRRKEELRARMARIAGGMGGMGAIFGGPVPTGAPAPPKKKTMTTASDRHATEASEEPILASAHAPPVPTMMALPGMSRVKSNESQPQDDDEAEEEDDDTDTRTPHQEHAPPNVPSRETAPAPPVPGGRPAPPPVPTESRPPPPLPPAAVMSPSEGSESGDELSERPEHEDTPHPPPATIRPPPPLPPLVAPSAPPPITSPTSPKSHRRSYIGGDGPLSPTIAPPVPSGHRRDSRLPPPVPGSAPAVPPQQSRPPPPLPPAALSRSSTADTQQPLSPTRLVSHDNNLDDDDEPEEEVTEYEGDYDTDIASSVPHKDALKAHQRDSSFEDAPPVRAPEARPSLPPPVPSASAPTAPRGPPPLPSQPPPQSRRSVDVPRAAPPPPPPVKETPRYDTEDYDPYNYASPSAGVISPQPRTPARRTTEESSYFGSEASHQQSLPERRAAPPAAPSSRAPARQSMDVQRTLAPGRRSMDMARPSMESGYVANDIDLANHTGWWLKPNSVPPQLQGRKDLFFESEESKSSDSNGKTMVTRDIYVLFQDYSQTVITARYDAQDQSDVQLEQRHEAPPRALRQDQLEQAYERFGRAIGDSVSKMKDTVVGDGTPQALVCELLKPHRDALHPVGTRAYGALVYSNLANASTTQNDEIRPGDIISIRNAKFQGKHGPMHAKYSAEVGKPDHVGIVSEWDGTKKKVRAWEQGRESKKVKVESFKLDDLRSGEVKIWRVMPRSWVGWEGGN